MKKIATLAFLVSFLALGCGDDKKTAIPTKLDNELPKVAAPAGGGGGGATKAPQNPTGSAN